MTRTHANSAKPSPGRPSKSAKKFSPQRRWIGWDRPILPQVVDQLLKDYATHDSWDMRHVLLVLPGSMARRRLNELLVLTAKQQQKIMRPPQIVTVGTLPEQLYVAKYPFASDLIQQLAWVEALRSTPTSVLYQVVPAPPTKSASQSWLELAKVFSSLHRELASDGLNFDRVVKALGHHPERARWQALADIQARYLTMLDAQQLWDVQTARLCALEFHEPTTTQQLIVVGCVDLNRTQRGFLEQVAEQVAVWIAAPESAADMFDDFGCLQGSAWLEHRLDIPDECLLVGNSPTDQAELTCASLAQLGSRYHVRDVSIGVPDPKLIAELTHHLDQVGIQARFGPGNPLTQSDPASLLSLIGRYLNSRGYAEFATLIRHPIMASWLVERGLPNNWLTDIDQYYQTALPKQIDTFVNTQATGSASYLAVTTSLEDLLKPLSAKAKPISQWVEPLLQVMSQAYSQQAINSQDPAQAHLVLAAQGVCEAIGTLRDIPSSLEPTLTISELIDWLLRGMHGQLIPAPANAEAVELMGWLELSLDDTPALIITGIHDGVVPESVSADAFLPNGLRRQLGMMDNVRRYARDAYALQVILGTREELRIVVGKTDANGDPLVPSRLLMACDLALLPQRVLRLVKQEYVDQLPPLVRKWKQRGGASELPIPQPTAGRTVSHMTVTAFRDYLACPYRFYLRHVLKLRESQDAHVELDAPMFGNLIHDTLEQLGRGPAANCTDAKEIEQFLLDNLRQVAQQRYGLNPPAAVVIQTEQAEQRLKVFAQLQAERAQQGWIIQHTECGVGLDNPVLLEPGGLPLIGRIDRIDYHPATGRWAIWDYKTSDSAKRPLAVHWHPQEGWKDLQLPLYRPLAERFGVERPTLGYIALPKQAADIGFYGAEFTADQLFDADQTARRITAKIAAGEFGSGELADVEYDDYARICQSHVQRVEVPPPRRLVCPPRGAAQPLSAAIVSEAQRKLQKEGTAHNPLPPLLIRASAGTGKTFQLSNRLLQIVLSGQEIDTILASTFTRKAAGEIMHRVLERLAVGCLSEQSRHELAQHLVGVDTSAPACLAALRRLTRSIHRLRIGTLDSFFAQLARSFSLEMALPPGWSALDPVQEPVLQLQAIGQMLDNHDRGTLVELVRMLSKGESGRQVADQIRQTIAAGFNVYRVSSPQAWDQLPVPAAPSEAALEAALLTLESAQVLTKAGAGHKPARAQLDKLHLAARTGDWEQVIEHGIYKNINADPASYYGLTLEQSLVFALKVLAERAAAELLTIRRDQTRASYKILKAYDSEYLGMLRGRRVLSFSDVTYFLSRWLAGDGAAAQKNRPRPAESAITPQQLAFRLDCNVQHLLLDEFQDTAPEQWQILRPLAAPLGGQPSSDSSFFCVGDTKQAIYGWRGGVAEIFGEVGRTVSHLQESVMSESFRSSPEVMQVVNDVFTNLTAHTNFSQCDAVAAQWSKEFPLHRTAREKLVGYVRLQNGPLPEKGATAEQRKQVYLQLAASQIAELTQQSQCSVGVLFRTNDDVAYMISLLREQGVSASQDGGNPLCDSAAVELLLSLVHLADHPGDGACAYHVGHSPLAQALPFCPLNEPHELAKWFRKQVSWLGLGRTIESLADLLANKLSWWDQHRVQQLIRSAYEFQGNFTGRLRDFEAAVERNRIALPSEAQVKVMTIHKSKGLEFDAVFLPELTIELSASSGWLVLRGNDPCQPPDGVVRYMNQHLQALLPEGWQRAFAQHKQRGVTESLCLLYVAMTRARQALYMFVPPGGENPRQDLASLLQSTLSQSLQPSNELRRQAEAVLYERGNPLWYQTQLPSSTKTANRKALKEEAGNATRVDNTAAEPLKVQLRVDAESAPLRKLQVSAPSLLEPAANQQFLGQIFSISHSQGAMRGTILHALFEQIEWLEDFQFDQVNLRRVAFSSLPAEVLQHVSIDNTLRQFAELLKLSSVRQVLSRARYQQPIFGDVPERIEVDRERAVSSVLDQNLYSGTIDRLVLLFKNDRPYAAEIFDFKTDQVDHKVPLLWWDERVRHHSPQLEIYARVVGELYGLPRDRIHAHLIMLAVDRSVIV